MKGQGGGTTIHSANAFPTSGLDRPLTPNSGAWSHFLTFVGFFTFVGQGQSQFEGS